MCVCVSVFSMSLQDESLKRKLARPVLGSKPRPLTTSLLSWLVGFSVHSCRMSSIALTFFVVLVAAPDLALGRDLVW